MRRLMVLMMIGGALFVGAPAQADAGCPWSVTVQRSRSGNGIVNGTIYEDIDVEVFRGAKRLRVAFLSGENVLYHQWVKAFPRKTTMFVHLGAPEDVAQLDIEAVARRAGAEPQIRTYAYTCGP